MAPIMEDIRNQQVNGAEEGLTSAIPNALQEVALAIRYLGNCIKESRHGARSRGEVVQIIVIFSFNYLEILFNIFKSIFRSYIFTFCTGWYLIYHQSQAYVC